MAFNDDDDWDMLGEDAQLKGEQDAAGWGVDSSLYTTNLSGVSNDLRAKAKEMARQIIGEKKGGVRRQMNNAPAPSYVNSFNIENTLTRRNQTQYSEAVQRRRVERYLSRRCDENACTSAQETATTKETNDDIDKRE